MKSKPITGYHIPMGIYRCSILDSNVNFARILSCQESALINAFNKNINRRYSYFV